MGVRVTGDFDRSVALYDSVTGVAFGPVFDSIDDANNFMEWWNTYSDAVDLRTISEHDLIVQVERWKHATRN